MHLTAALRSRAVTGPARQGIDDPETELLRRIAAGDEDALRALYAACGQRLYAYALRLTGDPAAAEDVLQESLVAAWQGAGRFRGEGRAIAWLLGIVHHKALAAGRARPPQPLAGEDEAERAASPAPLPDELAARGEQRRLLQAGLARLPLEQRTALELVFYQGLSLEEAARVCACPLGTIKSRLNHAKTALRGLLSRDGLGGEELL